MHDGRGVPAQELIVFITKDDIRPKVYGQLLALAKAYYISSILVGALSALWPNNFVKNF